MWEINPGITSDATNYYILNTAARMRDVTGGNTLATDLFGATGIAALYTSLGATYGQLWATGATRTVGFGSPTAQTLSEATSGNAWVAGEAGIPLAGGGANAFGNDLVWDYKPNEMCPLAGGAWSNGSYAGVWALELSNVRAAFCPVAQSPERPLHQVRPENGPHRGAQENQRAIQGYSDCTPLSGRLHSLPCP